MLNSLSRKVVIDTPLQRGAGDAGDPLNRFSGFPWTHRARETAIVVEFRGFDLGTPLKRGVNETCRVEEALTLLSPLL